ncbi:MAG: hypothetical protein LBE84_12425, partial [Planctomycetota bacterium]|nr:hypothetical protein [Planctomycetota bacterium]
IDSERESLAEYRRAFADWADILRFGPDEEPDWDNPPDAIFVSAEIAGGPGGDRFSVLSREAGDIPILAVARWRSLTQALAFLRAGAGDYLSLPLAAGEAKERVTALLEKAGRHALRRFILEPVTMEPEDSGAGEPGWNGDILAGIAAGAADETPPEEPEAVDVLPVPALWEELPCGVLVFDSAGNLVFSNGLALALFGYESPATLRDALEGNRASFAAHSASRKPLADNQWPHVLARKVRAARSAVISIEKPDRRRLWLRIDCLPHLADGKVNRLSMTIVNLTGELPDFSPAPIPSPREKNRRKTARHRR